MPGLDVQDALAAAAFLANHEGVNAKEISLYGHRQGGMTALMTAALDKRISSVRVSDYFDQRNRCWAEPVDHAATALKSVKISATIQPLPDIKRMEVTPNTRSFRRNSRTRFPMHSPARMLLRYYVRE